MATVCPPCPPCPPSPNEVSLTLDAYMAEFRRDLNVSKLMENHPCVRAAIWLLELQGQDYIRVSTTTVDSADGTNGINTRIPKNGAVYAKMKLGEEFRSTTPLVILGTSFTGLLYQPFFVDWFQPDGSSDKTKPVFRGYISLGILTNCPAPVPPQ